MRTLIIPVGCPGMGKSYWAQNVYNKYGIKSVSSDQVRKELYGDASIQGDYHEVFTAVYDTICNLFEKGEQIIILDATNVTRHVRWKAIANTWPNELIYVIMPDGLDRALENNYKRERVVPDNIVRRMYKSYKRDMPSYQKDSLGKKCTIYYLDNEKESLALQCWLEVYSAKTC